MKTKNKMPELNLATSKDETRPIYNYVKVNKNNVVATNTHLLIWYKTEDLFDAEFIESIPEEGILIHREDWAKFKDCTISWHNDLIKLSHNKRRDIFIKPDTQKEIGTFPNWEAVIPKENEDFNPISEIRINAEYAALIQKIMQSEGLDFSFYGQNRGIICTPINNDTSGKALLMPMIKI